MFGVLRLPPVILLSIRFFRSCDTNQLRLHKRCRDLVFSSDEDSTSFEGDADPTWLEGTDRIIVIAPLSMMIAYVELNHPLASSKLRDSPEPFPAALIR